MKKLVYKGSVDFFKGKTYDVINVIHNGEPIGNGEVNNSGDDMYVCRYIDQTWIFRADEIELL